MFAPMAWNLPDPVPVHREAIYTNRPELVAKYPTRPDAREFRVMNIGFTMQKAAVDRLHILATTLMSILF